MEKTRILIVDDDPGLRKTLSDILRMKGYQTLVAKDGREGIAIMAEDPVNLILIDLGLPDMSGLEVLDRVKADHPAAQAIILTGNATLDSAVDATNRGAFSYLIKPYAIDQLTLHIRRAIEKQQADEKIVAHNVELQKVVTELKALYDISRAISGTIDMNELVSEILQVIAGTGILPFEIKGAIFLAERGELRLVSFHSISETMLKPCGSISIGECLCGNCAMSGEPVVLKNLCEEGRQPRCDPEMIPYGRIIVPLKAVDQVVGILSLFLPPEAVASDEQLRLLASIGNQIGIAISNARLYEEVKSCSLHDHLTGLANRRAMDIQLENCMNTAARYGESLSVIMLDIDHFKNYNDTHGHPAGDRLLVRMAEILIKEIRSGDFLFRYGGEEFLALLPRTDRVRACEAAERLRRAVEAQAGVTISLGVATLTDVQQGVEALIGSADQALYLAKQRGRNRVEFAEDNEPSAEAFCI